MKRTRKCQKLLIKEKKKYFKQKKQTDWGTVLNLLDQEFENSLRQDSRYHLTSLNKIVSDNGKYTELIELIPSEIFNPLDNLIEIERNKMLYKALKSLSFSEYKRRVKNNKSFRQLAIEFGSSDKTAKARFEKIRFKLQEELNDWRF